MKTTLITLLLSISTMLFSQTYQVEMMKFSKQKQEIDTIKCLNKVEIVHNKLLKLITKTDIYVYKINNVTSIKNIKYYDIEDNYGKYYGVKIKELDNGVYYMFVDNVKLLLKRCEQY